MATISTAPQRGVLASFRRTLGIASIAALLTAGLIAPPAQAVATPSSFVFDCDNNLADGTTNMTADIGDTFTIRNAGVARACAIGSFSSFLTITGLAGPTFLPTGRTGTATVNGAGTFTVTGTGAGVRTINVSAPVATPVPTSPLWLLGMMAGLLSLVAVTKLRKA